MTPPGADGSSTIALTLLSLAGQSLRHSEHEPGLAGVRKCARIEHADDAETGPARRDVSGTQEWIGRESFGQIMHGYPFTAEPSSDWTNWRWKTRNRTMTGMASTVAPARIAPNGLAARDATVEM